MQRRRRGEGVGTRGWGRGAATRCAVCLSLGRSVRPSEPAAAALPLAAPCARRAPAPVPTRRRRRRASAGYTSSSSELMCKICCAASSGKPRCPSHGRAGAAGPPRVLPPPPPSPRAATSTRRATCVRHRQSPTRRPSVQRLEAHAPTLSPPHPGCVCPERTWDTGDPSGFELGCWRANATKVLTAGGGGSLGEDHFPSPFHRWARPRVAPVLPTLFTGG